MPGNVWKNAHPTSQKYDAVVAHDAKACRRIEKRNKIEHIHGLCHEMYDRGKKSGGEKGEQKQRKVDVYHTKNNNRLQKQSETKTCVGGKRFGREREEAKMK